MDDPGSDPEQRTKSLAFAGGDRAMVRRFRLKVLDGPQAKSEFISLGQRVTIGTHQSADLRIGDDTMSRFHCEIVIQKGRALLRDLGSLNGTVVDGVSVLVAHLADKATLTLGSTRVRFQLGSDEVEIPLSTADRFGLLVGRSQVMRAAMAELERAAANDVTVLLQGETGTGKDAAAESIHRESARRDGPFVVVDCASIPSALMESELFGHRKGSFTGADQSRVGAFAAASGGTILLDEIGELAVELQPKLLRVLETRTVQQVGSTGREPVDVRVIAATNRNLRQEVNERRFRPDLYYRLAVVEIALPSLRQRPEDIPILVDALLAAGGSAAGPAVDRLRSAATQAELARHLWPGNVRELRNYVERCLAFDDPPRLAGSELAEPSALAVDTSKPLRVERDRWIRRVEHDYLEKLLAEHGDNVSAAARAAGIDRIHMYRLLWRAGLRETGDR
jgi:two-component system response regulator GlrR